MNTLQLIGDYMVLSFLLPLLLFVIFYLTRSNWSSTGLGVIVLLQKIGFSLIMITAILRLFFPETPGLPIVRLVVYVMVFAMLCADVVVLIRFQNRPHDVEIPAVRHWWNRKKSL